MQAIVKEMAKTQVGFINKFVAPLFVECKRVFPCQFTENCVDTIEKNLQYWRKMQLSCNTMSRSMFEDVISHTKRKALTSIKGAESK